MPTFTTSNPVVVGAATKKTDYDVVFDNTQFLYQSLIGTGDLGADVLIQNSRAFRMSKVGLAHGMTSVVPTDQYGRINALDGTNGGFNINAFSLGDNVAFNISGCSGSTAPTTPVNTIRAFKKSGTSVGAIASTEIALSLQNSTTTYAQFYGNGKLQWRDAAVAHGMTDFELTDSYGQLFINSATAGGIRLRGITDTNDTTAVNLTGIIQAGSTTAGAVAVDTYKRSGTGAIGLDTSDIAFTVGSNGTQFLISQPRMFSSTADSMCVGFNGVAVVSGASAHIYIGSTDFFLNYNSGDPQIAFGSGGNISYTGSTGKMSISANTGIIIPTGYIEGTEQTAPASPATNHYRLFAKDNGSGKTQLMVLFATGAAQQISIEP